MGLIQPLFLGFTKDHLLHLRCTLRAKEVVSLLKMINTIEEYVKAEIYREVAVEYPGLDESDSREYFRLCMRKFDREGHLRTDERKRKISKSYTLKSFFNQWAHKMSLGYEFLDFEGQEKKDRMVLENMIHFFCGKSNFDNHKIRMALSAYKVYWREVKDKRKLAEGSV